MISPGRLPGRLFPHVRESADEIRHFGNYGLHIQDDGLDSVSSEEATDVAEIAWQLLHSLYIAPAKTAELRKKRGSKGGP